MTQETSALNTPAGRPLISGSRGLVDWLGSQNVSLAISTYQTGKLFLIGRNEDAQFSVFERTFERAMGLAGNDQTIYMATLYQLWRLENVLQPGETTEGYDRSYVPQVGYTTGDLNVHDVALDRDSNPLFISARFSCLATNSDRYNFRQLWMPPFISKLAGEDRCHLNGLAMVDGRARYVTACSETDIVDGWREHRRDGGIVIDVQSDEIIARGFSMPHSPRWYRDKLWLLDAGTGYFGFLDIASGRFERVTFCPGFARGLSFVGNYAVVGISLPRHDPTFVDLPLQENLEAAKVSARCGLLVIDLASGDVVEWMRMEEPIRELYDVLILPGVQRPRLVGFKTDEIRNIVWSDPDGNSLGNRASL
jgi:uncharacterized protein (TIGR03032 family)